MQWKAIILIPSTEWKPKLAGGLFQVSACSTALLWVLGVLDFHSVLRWRCPPGLWGSGGLTLLEVISKVTVKA